MGSDAQRGDGRALADDFADVAHRHWRKAPGTGNPRDDYLIADLSRANAVACLLTMPDIKEDARGGCAGLAG